MDDEVAEVERMPYKTDNNLFKTTAINNLRDCCIAVVVEVRLALESSSEQHR